MKETNISNETSSERTEELIKKKLRKSRFHSVIIIVIILVLVVGGFYIWTKTQKEKWVNVFKPEEISLSAETITAKLESASELTTSKVTLKGIAEYSDGGWYVINKGDFVMVYESEVKAGIDVKKIKFAVDDENKIVYIYIPDAEILNIKVLPESIKYYNESFALFNFDKKDDANKAQLLAEEAAQEDALNAGLLDLANTQSETLVKGILEEVVKDYEMKFLRSEKELDDIKTRIETTKSTTDTTNTKE